MKIFFSPEEQVFYDTDLNYPSLPNDLVSVSFEQHQELSKMINEGRHVFKDLTFTEPRPSSFHKLINGKWVDDRSPLEKRQQYLNSLRLIDRRQLKLALLKAKHLDKVEPAIASIEDEEQRMTVEIEWQESSRFERLNPSLLLLFKKMGLKESQVDRLWEEGLKL